MSAPLTHDTYRAEHPTISMILADLRLPRTDPAPVTRYPRSES